MWFQQKGLWLKNSVIWPHQLIKKENARICSFIMWRTFVAFSHLSAGSSLVIKITLQHRWNFMPMHTDACQDGARSFQAQQPGLWSRGWKNQIPQWVLMRACWTADLPVCWSGKWNVKNYLYQAQFGVKALLLKALIWGLEYFKSFFWLPFQFCFDLFDSPDLWRSFLS